MIIPVLPLGDIPPGHGSAPGEKADQITYPSAGARIGVPAGI